MLDPDQREIVSDLLRGAVPVNPVSPTAYITREEFESKVSTIEAKIENEALKTKLWVMAGVLAIITSFGGGYVSLVSRIDRITEALPEITKVQDGRREWIQRQDLRDSHQDEALRKLDRSYQGIPFEPSPQ